MSGTAARRGLGRGLNALLGDMPLPTQPRGAGGVRDVAVASIKPNPFQPRKDFDGQALDDMKRSISEFGVLVPVLVRERGEEYELIAGERRWRASASLQRATIPAIVRASDDRETLEIAIVENLQREDLNALEEAAGIAHLIDEYAYTQEEAARRLGKSRPAIANALRLLALPEAIKALILAKQLSAGHARALLAAPEADRIVLAQRAARDGLTVRSLERLAAALSAPDVPKQRTSRTLPPEHRDFEARLRAKLATRVTLRRGTKGGKLEIGYSDEKDLMRIADLLVGPTG